MAKVIPKEREEVLMHLRKSIFVLYRQMFVFLVAVCLSFGLLIFLYEQKLASVAAALLLLTAFVYGFYYFLVWYYDVYSITNIRILTFSKKGLFHTTFSEVAYKEINGVSFVVNGILQTLFQYGTVQLSLNNGEVYELSNVSTPGVVQDTIKNLIDASRNLN